MLCSYSLANAADLPAESVKLQRIRIQMARNLKSLPDYTCTQTIERYLRPGANKKEKLSDTVRLEVAFVHGTELFAWPGSGHFRETDISEMVKGGAIGTGNFAIHVKNLFQTNAPQFRYAGEVEENGRKLLRWYFSVPQLLSGYQLRVGKQEATVGYHGSFWADASTLDLVRLEVEADDIPVDLGLESATDFVEYARMDIGGGSFLLPTRSGMALTGFGGGRSTNRVKFSSCRHYSGESVLIFEDPSPEEMRREPVRLLQAPAGIDLYSSLDTVIRAGDIAIGDPVRSQLVKPARIGAGIIAPKGAVLAGRVASLVVGDYNRFPGFYVGIEMSELSWENTRVQLRSALEDVTSVMPQIYLPRQVLASPSAAGSATMKESVFFVRGSGMSLGKGLRMIWRTLPVEVGEKK